MKIKEIAEKMSYDVVGVNDECDRDFYIDAFTDGAKTMIDKACKWLINIDFDDFHFRDCDETFNNDLFVDAFRKAMEEEK